jgi:hypothetical protein
MPQFRIDAADQGTGQARIVILEANDERDAERQARTMGLAVRAIHPGVSPQGGGPRRCPGWAKSLAITCLLTGLGGLYFSYAWQAATTHDAYETFNRIWGFVGVPTDAMLVTCSVGLMLCKSWARKWLIYWAIISFAYQTAGLGITLVWTARHAQTGDLSAADSAMLELENAMADKPDPNGIAGTIDYDAEFGWVSMLSLQGWAFMALRRKKAVDFFEQINERPQPHIPQIAPPGRAE